MATHGNTSEQHLMECLARYLLTEIKKGKKTRRYVELKYTENQRKSPAFREKLKAELNKQRTVIFKA